MTLVRKVTYRIRLFLLASLVRKTSHAVNNHLPHTYHFMYYSTLSKGKDSPFCSIKIFITISPRLVTLQITKILSLGSESVIRVDIHIRI